MGESNRIAARADWIESQGWLPSGTYRLSLPTLLEVIILQALSKEARQRQQSMADILSRLAPLRESLDTSPDITASAAQDAIRLAQADRRFGRDDILAFLTEIDEMLDAPTSTRSSRSTTTVPGWTESADNCRSSCIDCSEKRRKAFAVSDGLPDAPRPAGAAVTARAATPTGRARHIYVGSPTRGHGGQVRPRSLCSKSEATGARRGAVGTPRMSSSPPGSFLRQESVL
jgi:hypothetical protein